MFEFLKRPYPFSDDLGSNLRIGSGIAIGVFLFILFFQPFGLDSRDTNSYILTIAGFAGMAFILTGLVKILLPGTFRGLFRIDHWNLQRELLLLALIWILNSVAFSFYLVYVGHVHLSMYLAFRITLICLVIPVIILVAGRTKHLHGLLENAQRHILELREKSEAVKPAEEQPLELHSENRSEKLVLEPGSLILVKSAENYVEIVFRENGNIRKKMLRSTMLAMEDQLRPVPGMVRCHRTCIIHAVPGVRIQRTSGGMKLSIPGYEEDVPLSRQYLLGVREALEHMGK